MTDRSIIWEGFANARDPGGLPTRVAAGVSVALE